MRSNCSEDEKPFIPTVEETWKIYLESFPANATACEIRQAKRSFFCGVRSTFLMLEQIASVTGVGQRAMLEAELLKQECERFAELVQQGKA